MNDSNVSVKLEYPYLNKEKAKLTCSVDNSDFYYIFQNDEIQNLSSKFNLNITSILNKCFNHEDNYDHKCYFLENEILLEFIKYDLNDTLQFSIHLYQEKDINDSFKIIELKDKIDLFQDEINKIKLHLNIQ